MDFDSDEDRVAYFLPDGIADDSPPRRPRPENFESFTVRQYPRPLAPGPRSEQSRNAKASVNASGSLLSGLGGVVHDPVASSPLASGLVGSLGGYEYESQSTSAPVYSRPPGPIGSIGSIGAASAPPGLGAYSSPASESYRRPVTGPLPQQYRQSMYPGGNWIEGSDSHSMMHHSYRQMDCQGPIGARMVSQQDYKPCSPDSAATMQRIGSNRRRTSSGDSAEPRISPSYVPKSPYQQSSPYINRPVPNPVISLQQQATTTSHFNQSPVGSHVPSSSVSSRNLAELTTRPINVGHQFVGTPRALQVQNMIGGNRGNLLRGTTVNSLYQTYRPDDEKTSPSSSQRGAKWYPCQDNNAGVPLQKTVASFDSSEIQQHRPVSSGVSESPTNTKSPQSTGMKNVEKHRVVDKSEDGIRTNSQQNVHIQQTENEPRPSIREKKSNLKVEKTVSQVLRSPTKQPSPSNDTHVDVQLEVEREKGVGKNRFLSKDASEETSQKEVTPTSKARYPDKSESPKYEKEKTHREKNDHYQRRKTESQQFQKNKGKKDEKDRKDKSHKRDRDVQKANSESSLLSVNGTIAPGSIMSPGKLKAPVNDPVSSVTATSESSGSRRKQSCSNDWQVPDVELEGAKKNLAVGSVNMLVNMLKAGIPFVLPILHHIRLAVTSRYRKVAGNANLWMFMTSLFGHVVSLLGVFLSFLFAISVAVISLLLRLHRHALSAFGVNRHIGFCFTFLYAFPFLVQYIIPWAPPWAPVCLWYAFLVQLFCTQGPTAMVAAFRLILPLMFLLEGVSHHSFLLDLNGAELLLISFILSSVKMRNICSPLFFLSLAAQCISAVFLGSQLLVQWCQLIVALFSLHSMALASDEWPFRIQPLSFDEMQQTSSALQNPHSMADYHHISSSTTSSRRTKRVDRRSSSYAKSRKGR